MEKAVAILFGAIFLAVAIGMGIAAVIRGIKSALSLVDWSPPQPSANDNILLMIMVLAIVGGLVFLAWQTKRDIDKEAAARAREAAEKIDQVRRDQEISKPRIPETLTYSQQDGLRNFNAELRPDLEEIDQVREDI